MSRPLSSRTGTASKVLHRSLAKQPPTISHGEGMYLYDKAGRRYLDASGGAAVSCLGHADPEVTEAVRRQMEAVAYTHSGFFTSDAAESLADRLVAKCPGTRVALFCNSGSAAMEAALKMTRQYHLEKGEEQRTHIISRLMSYHGTTLGALGVGGLTERQKPFDPWLMGARTSRISACYPYREKCDGETDAAFVNRLCAEFEQDVLRLGPGTVAAFVAETIGGATLGVVPPVAGYFRAIRKICDRYGILLVLDEIMCGMGRCGHWLACEQEGVTPDIVCVAKGLGGGFQPIAAMLVNDRVYDALANGSGAFMHGQTYMGHAAACAAAAAVLDKIERLDLVGKVRTTGPIFRRLLDDAFADHPHVGEIRGRGFFWGIELVADRRTKLPFPPSIALYARIKSAAMQRGLLCYPGGGALPGGMGDHVLLAPPFIATENHLAEIASLLHDSVADALATVE